MTANSLLMCTPDAAPAASADERALVSAARRGSGDAMAEIVRRYQARVHTLAYRMLRDREAAEDIVQETFLRVLRGLPRLRDDGALRPWIMRIAANLVVALARQRAYDDRALAEAARAAETEWHDHVDPALAADVHRAVAQLPPHYRLAVVAYYLEGKSYLEAARGLGLPVGTLKVRLFRARAMLRQALQEPETGGDQ